jgi:hypothetical protein
MTYSNDKPKLSRQLKTTKRKRNETTKRASNQEIIEVSNPTIQPQAELRKSKRILMPTVSNPDPKNGKR